MVPNLYPAFERQEVVIHSPEHVRSFADLGDEQIAAVSDAWERRAADAGAGLFAFINEGRLAGASLPHSHSQLVWTQLPQEQLQHLPELLKPHELRRRGDVIAAVHPLGAAPYESLIAPEGGEGALVDGLILLRDLVRRLRAVEGARPWNAWLHPGHSWHIHLVPRLTALAGIELGAGVYVNVVPPERAADRLRESP